MLFLLNRAGVPFGGQHHPGRCSGAAGRPRSYRRSYPVSASGAKALDRWPPTALNSVQQDAAIRTAERKVPGRGWNTPLVLMAYLPAGEARMKPCAI